MIVNGRCATPGCKLPAQPGRGKCANCIRAGIADGATRRAPFEAKLTDLDAPGATAGASKSPALPRSNVVQRTAGPGMSGFRSRRR